MDDDEFDDETFWDEDEPAPPPLRLSAGQEADLASALDTRLQQEGCDNTLHAARAWAVGAGMDPDELQAALEGRGGFCDCEVVLNVGLHAL